MKKRVKGSWRLKWRRNAPTGHGHMGRTFLFFILFLIKNRKIKRITGELIDYGGGSVLSFLSLFFFKYVTIWIWKLKSWVLLCKWIYVDISKLYTPYINAILPYITTRLIKFVLVPQATPADPICFFLFFLCMRKKWRHLPTFGPDRDIFII